MTAPNPEPVTNADEFSPWVASIVSAADIIRAYLDREDPDVSRLLFNQDVEGMAMALDAAGRLVPAGARERWSVACQSCSPDGWTPGPGCAVCWPVPTTKETP